MTTTDWRTIKHRIAASGIDQRDLAVEMDLSVPALRNRVYGYTPWSEDEIEKLDTILTSE